MIIEKDELISLLPHKGKMFLLDRTLACDSREYSIETQVDVMENSMFFDSVLGGIPSYVTFEYMAQSISALSGLVNREHNLPPRVGVILSVSEFKTYKPILSLGSKVNVTVVQQDKVDKVFSFSCSASVDGKIIANGKLTVMEVEDLKELGI